LFDDSEHTVENGLLTIPNVRAEDFGEYVCHARNKYGHAEAIIELSSGGDIIHMNVMLQQFH
jgi:Immunoglobulin I-set domain